MKKRVISCLLICVAVVLSLISCTPKEKTFAGKTYTVSSVEVRLNSSLNSDNETKLIKALKTAYGDEAATLKEVLKSREEEIQNEVSTISYKFEKNGVGVYTIKRDSEEDFTCNFQYEVHGKDEFLVLWFVDDEGNKIGSDQVFEIDGKKLVIQSSEASMVVKTVFKKSKSK